MSTERDMDKKRGFRLPEERRPPPTKNITSTQISHPMQQKALGKKAGGTRTTAPCTGRPAETCRRSHRWHPYMPTPTGASQERFASTQALFSPERVLRSIQRRLTLWRKLLLRSAGNFQS